MEESNGLRADFPRQRQLRTDNVIVLEDEAKRSKRWHQQSS